MRRRVRKLCSTIVFAPKAHIPELFSTKTQTMRSILRKVYAAARDMGGCHDK